MTGRLIDFYFLDRDSQIKLWVVGGVGGYVFVEKFYTPYFSVRTV